MRPGRARTGATGAGRGARHRDRHRPRGAARGSSRPSPRPTARPRASTAAPGSGLAISKTDRRGDGRRRSAWRASRAWAARSGSRCRSAPPSSAATRRTARRGRRRGAAGAGRRRQRHQPLHPRASSSPAGRIDVTTVDSAYDALVELDASVRHGTPLRRRAARLHDAGRRRRAAGPRSCARSAPRRHPARAAVLGDRAEPRSGSTTAGHRQLPQQAGARLAAARRPWPRWCGHRDAAARARRVAAPRRRDPRAGCSSSRTTRSTSWSPRACCAGSASTWSWPTTAPRGWPRVADRARGLRRRPDGLPDAGDGRLRRHPRDPRDAGRRPARIPIIAMTAAAVRRRAAALPRRRDGRLPAQAGRRRRAGEDARPLAAERSCAQPRLLPPPRLPSRRRRSGCASWSRTASTPSSC